MYVFLLLYMYLVVLMTSRFVSVCIYMNLRKQCTYTLNFYSVLEC